MNASWTAMLRGKRCGGTISKEKRERIREKVYDLTVVNRKTRTERRRSFSAASQRLRQVRLLASHQCGITSPSRIRIRVRVPTRQFTTLLSTARTINLISSRPHNYTPTVPRSEPCGAMPVNPSEQCSEHAHPPGSPHVVLKVHNPKQSE